MPEQPIVRGWAHIINRRKGSAYKLSDKPRYSLKLHPAAFPMGSESKDAPTVTVNREAFTSLGPHGTVSSVVRSQSEGWEYLLYSNAPGGELFCRTRGKLMILAAGHHAVIISFALEGHINGMSRGVYDEIIAHDIPGPDKERGELVRSFLIPDCFTVPGSSSFFPRTINIYCAFVSENWVWTVADFSRLLRLHVISRDRVWDESDFVDNTPEWSNLFSIFKGGPDWVSEVGLAEQALDHWKDSIVQKHEDWKTRVREWEMKEERRMKKLSEKGKPQSTFRIEGYFLRHRHHHSVDPSSAATKTFERHRPEGSYSTTSYSSTSSRPKPHSSPAIIQDICSNAGNAFSRFGRHTANDILYQLAIHPATPVHLLCIDDSKYEELKRHLHTYMVQFSSTKFLREAASISNNANPFAFNERSNKIYISMYIHVFRRTTAKVPKALYDKYASLGLFDPKHTVGDPYPAHLVVRCKKGSKYVGVNFHSKPLRAYSIISAKTSPDWPRVETTPVIKDISKYGFATTIGLAQFREHLLNRIYLVKNQSNNLKHQLHRRKKCIMRQGRPSKVSIVTSQLF
ncbi:hypothetical protein Hypma_003892 [Hypsizygus marmoreus]|uniref:Uncharacterized protein n=1 Tax=Hypsizygus marmoreus TaxID=39966 RepID=A0A369K4D6_HYPMA|nr:hypothetical protein Hypma_003892 [Hypsizygus marmoreus]